MQKTIVENDEVLYRRVQAGRNYKVPQSDGTFRLSSMAFSDPNYRPSVNRAELCNNNPTKVQLKPSDGVVSVIACDVRAIDTVIQYDQKNRPVQYHNIDVEHMPEQNNYAHAEIYATRNQKSRSIPQTNGKTGTTCKSKKMGNRITRRTRETRLNA